MHPSRCSSRVWFGLIKAGAARPQISRLESFRASLRVAAVLLYRFQNKLLWPSFPLPFSPLQSSVSHAPHPPKSFFSTHTALPLLSTPGPPGTLARTARAARRPSTARGVETCWRDEPMPRRRRARVYQTKKIRKRKRGRTKRREGDGRTKRREGDARGHTIQTRPRCCAQHRWRAKREEYTT